jgi:hypothetical protein
MEAAEYGYVRHGMTEQHSLIGVFHLDIRKD